jgi:hypothetical protein
VWWVEGDCSSSLLASGSFFGDIRNTRLHDATSQKTVIFILAAVRT